jgi:hypothetical protein
MKAKSILLRSAIAVIVVMAGFEALRTRDASEPPKPVKATAIAKPIAPPPPSCKTDWKLCRDNADLVNNWSGYYRVAGACKAASERLAKYGDPEWPWFVTFRTFNNGDDYPKTGKVTAIETEARYPNAFNAKVLSRVTCTYDINTAKVTDIMVAAR